MTNPIGTCPNWGEEYDAIAVYHPANRTYAVATSPRAGSGYEIDEVLLNSSVLPMPLDEKARLTTWLVDQLIQGIRCPEITEAIIDYVKSRRSLSANERAERLLRFIDSQAVTVSTTVAIRQESHAAYAWSESTDWDEVVYFLDYLEEMRLTQGQRTAEGSFYGGLTVNGYSVIADLNANVDSSQAFVAMWFHDSMKEALERGIEPAIRDAGYKPLRIDQKEHVNKIDDEIIAELRRSRFLVADFTHGDEGARGGVYYEAGFAHGLNLPVVLTCRENAVGTLHFDTNHYNHIVWATPGDLREKLKKRILAVIGDGPEAHRSP